LSPEQLLGSAEFDPNDTVIADFEAGVGTLTRLEEQKVDTVVIVVEATPKSIEVGLRAVSLANEKLLQRVVVVANRVRHEADVETIRNAFSAYPDVEIVAVPDDDKIREADRFGVAPIDHAPDAPAVRALVGLAEGLLPKAG
jgi:CO dehydrogenase maturation factor